MTALAATVGSILEMTMSEPTPSEATRRIDAARKLLHEAVRGVTDLVEQSHEQVAGHVVNAAKAAGVGDQAEVIDDLRRLLTRASLAGVRGANAVAEAMGNVASDAIAGNDSRVIAAARAAGAAVATPRLAPLRSDALAGAEGVMDAAIGALNGAFGDGLVARGNGLDLGMAMRLGDPSTVGDALLDPRPEALQAQLRAAFAAAAPTSGVVVLVHGLATTEWSFCLGAAESWGDAGTTFATLLRKERGLLPIYVRYNTGRPVADNGAALQAWLDAIHDALQVIAQPLQRLVLVGHSMGGLVVRDAVGRGVTANAGWLDALDAAACLGTPHLGAPLERVVAVITETLALVPLPGASVPAALLKLRSAGIRDLGKGDIGDLENAPAAWKRASLPSTSRLRWLLVACTVAEDTDGLAAKFFGDGMVARTSATGPSRASTNATSVVIGGVSHAVIGNHPKAYYVLRSFLDQSPDGDGDAQPFADADRL